jgi:hypothetical protein
MTVAQATLPVSFARVINAFRFEDAAAVEADAAEESLRIDL